MGHSIKTITEAEGHLKERAALPYWPETGHMSADLQATAAQFHFPVEPGWSYKVTHINTTGENWHRSISLLDRKTRKENKASHFENTGWEDNGEILPGVTFCCNTLDLRDSG